MFDDKLGKKGVEESSEEETKDSSIIIENEVEEIAPEEVAPIVTENVELEKSSSHQHTSIEDETSEDCDSSNGNGNHKEENEGDGSCTG